MFSVLKTSEWATKVEVWETLELESYKVISALKVTR